MGAEQAVSATHHRDGSHDPRRIAAAEFNKQLPPEAKALHLYDLDATMEDTELLGMAFHGQGYTLPVYSYHAWWRHADLGPPTGTTGAS